MKLWCPHCKLIRNSQTSNVSAHTPNLFTCRICGTILVDPSARGTRAGNRDGNRAGTPAEVAPVVPKAKLSNARLFVLRRVVDCSGVSGTGIVAEGVCFSNGKVALHWLSHLGAVNVYDSMQVVEALHGHDGNTKVEWVEAA